MGWGGLDAPAPYAGTRWGAGWSPLLLLNLPASEDSSCTIQIKQMTKGTRVGMGPRSKVAFSVKLMSTGDHNKSNFENAQPLLSTLFKLWGVCVGVGGGRNGVGGVVVVVVVDGGVGQQLSVTVSRHPAIVQLQLWHPQALSSLSLIVRKCVKYALIVYSCVRGTKHFYVTVDIESVKIAEIILILDFVCSFRCLPQTYSTSWSTSRVFFPLIFWQFHFRTNLAFVSSSDIELFQDHIQEVLNKWQSIDDEIWAKIIVLERNRWRSWSWWCRWSALSCFFPDEWQRPTLEHQSLLWMGVTMVSTASGGVLSTIGL